MSDRFPGIFRDQLFQVCLSPFMFLVGGTGPPIGRSKLRPGIGGAHIDNTDGLQPRSRRLDPKQPGLLPAPHAAPELLFGGQEQVLVQRVRTYRQFDPLPAPRDDR